jgi:hypothetical protein
MTGSTVRFGDCAEELPETKVSHAVHLDAFMVSLGAYWKNPRLGPGLAYWQPHASEPTKKSLILSHFLSRTKHAASTIFYVFIYILT